MRFFIHSLLLVLLSSVISSCCSLSTSWRYITTCDPTNSKYAPNIKTNMALSEIAIEMAKAERIVNEYGHINVSALLMVPSTTQLFDFDLGGLGGASNFYTAARTDFHGASAVNLKQAFALGASLERARDPTSERAFKEALTNNAEAVAGYQTASDISNNTPIVSNLVTLPLNTTTSVLGGDKLPDIGSLITNLSELKIPPRSAMITAAGDAWIEAIFKVLGNPTKTAAFQDKTILFSVGMLSVNPGTRTRKDFAGEIILHPVQKWGAARSEVVDRFVALHEKVLGDNKTAVAAALKSASSAAWYGTNLYATIASNSDINWTLILSQLQHSGISVLKKVPEDKKMATIVGVSPMTEAHNLDLRSGYQSRTEIGLDMADVLRKAGLVTAADFMVQWAQQRQSDARTLTPDVAVNAFSKPFMFGYEIGPVLIGQEDAGSRKSKAGRVLTRQSFPILTIMGLEKGDTDPILVVDMNPCENICRVTLYEPTITILQTTRWIPINKSGTRRNLPVTWYEQFASSFNRLSSSTNITSKSLQLRFDALASFINGTFNYQHLPIDLVIAKVAKPADKNPTVSAIHPARVSIRHNHTSGADESTDVEFIITGQNLDKFVGATVSSRNSVATNLKTADGDATHLTFQATILTASQSPLLFTLTKEGKNIQLPPVELITNLGNLRQIRYERTTLGKPDEVLTVTFPDNISERMLEAVMRSSATTSAPSANKSKE
ncbi:MAG TPA: hypothetical protein PJ991_10525 [Kiritimatiellia bacterium]|nr:hypothetical protein [Kiritimatiellia bacterium]